MVKCTTALLVMVAVAQAAVPKFDMRTVKKDIFGTPPPPATTNKSQPQECETSSGGLGVCDFAENCREAVSYTTNGYAIDFNRDNHNCPLTIMVCCPYRVDHPSYQEYSESNIIQQEKMGDFGNDVKENEMEPEEPTPTCGLRDNGKTPWFVIIVDLSKMVDENISQGNMGGGTLIHPSVVLCAAHSIHRTPSHQLQVLAGVTEEIIQDREVSNVVVHKNFHIENVVNDIALLFLKEPVELSPSLNVACLPSAASVPPPRCLAYERTLSQNNGRNGIKTVEVPTLSRQQCESLYRKTVLGSYFKLHSSFLCAGGEAAREICTGDGGFPLVCPAKNGRVVQYGIVVWDIDCGRHGNPSAYVDVRQFRDWIDHNVKSRGLSTAVYNFNQ